MKQIMSPKFSFLLEAPLEVLHSESLEWLQEIEFWKDESAFFYVLIIGRTKKNTPAFNTKNAKDVERHLVYVSAEKLDDLIMEVKAHERLLAGLMDSLRPDEQLYRSRHRRITAKIHAFENEFKEMKIKIFSLAKKITPKKALQ